YPILLIGASTTSYYTLSLHDALPISSFFAFGDRKHRASLWPLILGPLRKTSAADRNRWAESAMSRTALRLPICWRVTSAVKPLSDRKSTRLNSSHVKNSYAVFCLKKK